MREGVEQRLTAAGLAKPGETPPNYQPGCGSMNKGPGLEMQPLLENHTIGSSFPEDLQNAAGPTNPHPPMTLGGRSGGDRARYTGNQLRVGRHTEQRVTACTFEIGTFQDDEEERWRLPRWLGTSSTKPNSVDFQSKGSPRIRSPVGSGRFQSAQQPSSPAAQQRRPQPSSQRQIGGIRLATNSEGAVGREGGD